MAEKENELFQKINKVAIEYAESHSISKRSELISFVLGAIIDETPEQRICRLKRMTDLSDSVDYAWIFGVCAPKDLILDVFEESLGQKINKNGEPSKSFYNPEKGTKYTTYFVGLLKLRCGDKVYKNYNEPLSLNISKNDFDDNEHRPIFVKEPSADFDEMYDALDSGISIEKHPLIQMSGFFAELIKTKKTFPTTKGIYSLLVINFTRKPNGTFFLLNNFTKDLFEPADMGYVNKMTEFSKHRQDYLGLTDSKLSQYVFDNGLDEQFSPRDQKIRVLKDKSIAYFYEIKEATLSYQKKTILSQFAAALETEH